VLHENAAAGGCLPVEVNHRTAWKGALQRILSDAAYAAQLTAEATSRPLPRWNESAQTLATVLR